jgi:GxxExxY protein
LRLFAAISSKGKLMPTDVYQLCDTIRQTAYALHRFLGSGHLEKVYENGLLHRLGKLGMTVLPQHPLSVRDEDGTILGDYFADLFIDGRLIVEIKACKALADEHVAQLLGYLRASGIEHGLLINFGGGKFEIRKFILSRHEQ